MKTALWLLLAIPSPLLAHEATPDPVLFYYFKTQAPTASGLLETKLQTFQTAMKLGSQFVFVDFCDTQANPDKLKRLSEAVWELRPNFVMIGGDLVTTGSDKSHWTKHFFPHMRPLIDWPARPESL